MLNKSDDTQPWWKHGYVWLVIAGPAVVIVAALYTFYLASSSPNEIVTDPALVESINQQRLKGQNKLEARDAPADMARNHAATGPVPLPKAGPTATPASR